MRTFHSVRPTSCESAENKEDGKMHRVTKRWKGLTLAARWLACGLLLVALPSAQAQK